MMLNSCRSAPNVGASAWIASRPGVLFICYHERVTSRVILTSEVQVKRAVTAICKELQEGGRPVLVTISKYVPPRSLNQLAVLHSAIRQLAKEVGHTPSELKEWLKLEHGPTESVEVGGRAHVLPVSMGRYSRQQASDMLDNVQRIAADLGVLIEPKETNG